MRIWLVTIGEPVPVHKNARDRLFRTAYFAHFLADHGHDVTWWTSTFDHYRKRNLFENDTTLSINRRLQINLLHSCGYKSNVSVSRMRDHWQVAKKFSRLIRDSEIHPDVIISSLPTIELCLESVKFGKQSGIPVVLDTRDMWPDIFVDCAPKLLQPIARILLSPLFKNAALACSEATAILGITDAFVEWGIKRGQRQRTDLDRSFPMGYTTVPPPREEIRNAEKFWEGYGIPTHKHAFVACFFGALARSLDIKTIILAARKLKESNKPIYFVICGDGDFFQYYRHMASGLPNIVFPGRVDAVAIHTLMRHADIGLDPLIDRYDFLATINNKAIEYMSAGLPIISSPAHGVLFDLLAKEQCGLSYDCGDADGLVNILLKLWNDRVLVRNMAERSRQVFHEKFTAEKVYNEMMKHLEEIVKSVQ